MNPTLQSQQQTLPSKMRETFKKSKMNLNSTSNLNVSLPSRLLEVHI